MTPTELKLHKINNRTSPITEHEMYNNLEKEYRELVLEKQGLQWQSDTYRNHYLNSEEALTEWKKMFKRSLFINCVFALSALIELVPKYIFPLLGLDY